MKMSYKKIYIILLISLNVSAEEVILTFETCKADSAKIINISNKINARQNLMIGASESIDDNVLRTGDKATATFRFMHHPEYLKPGSRILMSEGMVKVIGVVV